MVQPNGRPAAVPTNCYFTSRHRQICFIQSRTLNHTPLALSPTLSPVVTKLTYSPSCSLATSLAQRTSRSGSTSGRKLTLVHQAEMTRTWALSRLSLSLPISLSWLVQFCAHIHQKVKTPVAEHLRPVVRPRRWNRPDPDHCHLPTLDGTHTFHCAPTANLCAASLL